MKFEYNIKKVVDARDIIEINSVSDCNIILETEYIYRYFLLIKTIRGNVYIIEGGPINISDDCSSLDTKKLDITCRKINYNYAKLISIINLFLQKFSKVTDVITIDDKDIKKYIFDLRDAFLNLS